MLTLQTFFPAFGLADPSPFVVKAMLLLKMSGLEHEIVAGDLMKSPKGKMPVLMDGATTIPDSSFIRFHLESAHGIDFDPGLSTEQKGQAWALEKMLEDQLYWAIVYERWMDNENFDKGPRLFFEEIPAIVRPVMIAFVRRQMKRNLWGHGLGRHSAEEVAILGTRSIFAISDVLGDKPFMLADHPTGVDAASYAFLSTTLPDIFQSDLKNATRSRPNLIAYVERMREKYFPELPPH